MAGLKPVYLIHGDDAAKVDEWRARVRKRAEAELGPGGLESFDGKASAPDELAAALATLTFSTGTRYLLADDVAVWKAPTLGPLTDAIGALAPDTVLVLIARAKPPLKGLLKAVEAAGGEVHEYNAPKPWEMHRWVADRASDQGLRIDSEAAKELVGIVGPAQHRLVRELEKIALAIHPETTIRLEHVDELAAGETSPKVYDLADAVTGGDLRATIALAEDLALNESPSRLVYPVVNRLREVRSVLAGLDAGLSEKDLASQMKIPPWRAKKAIALARKADREAVERALCQFADLEYDLRGGAALDEHTAVTLTLARAAG